VAAATVDRDVLRPSEWPFVAYFLYTAVLGVLRDGALLQTSAFALAVPLVLFALAIAERISPRRGWSMVRDWLPVVLLLVAYWSVDWVAVGHGDYEIENRIVRYDHRLLDAWKLRAAVESLGPILPAVLEIAYLAGFALLPATIAAFYIRHERRRIDIFLLPFLLGTLAVYAVLPHYPSEAPRVVFEGIDIPPIQTVFRSVNLWILDRWDIQSSVLPSGHVALAMSAALAMRIAVPERRSIWRALAALTLLVWIGSVYSRYHYVVDGLAAIVISAVVIGGWAIGATLLSKPLR
jgi:hypothetical protein